MKESKQINICKNFTDAIGFVAAFFALVAVFLAKEAFEPSDGITKFWQVETTKSYIMLAAVFFGAALISVLSRKVPTVCLPVSIVPLWLTFALFDSDRLTGIEIDLLQGRPTLYIIFGLAFFAGSVIYIGQWFADSRDFANNSRKSYISGFCYAAAILLLWLVPEFLLSDKWQTMLAPLFYVVSILGISVGVVGMVWYVMIPKGERRELDLWNSLAASVSCIALVVIRICLTKIGLF